MIMNTNSIHFSKKTLQSYTETMKPLAKKYDISSTMADIILFLFNNPEYKRAKDIVEVRGIKANLVSMNLERMEKEGYVTVEKNETDRREKTIHLTKKAEEIAKEGKKMQNAFFDHLFAGIDPNDLETFFQVFATINRNLDK